MTAPSTYQRHISTTAGICGGKPCIAGTRIRVQDIYIWHELQGQDADQIVAQFPQLTHADVYAALTYLWDHRDEIMAELRGADQTVQELLRAHPSKLPVPPANGN